MKYGIYIIGLILLLSACKSKNGAQEEEGADESQVRITEAQFGNMKMETGTLHRQPFNVVVKARGTVDASPENKAKVSSSVSGTVKDIYVRMGDNVSRGQSLLRIEGAEIIGLQQSYLEILEQLKYMESEYKRQQTLYSENIASEKKYLEAECNYKKAVATCEGLKQQLLLLRISPEKVQQGELSPGATLYAPITGTITQIQADMNRVIHPADVVVEMIDTRQLLLNLSVFEKDILDIKPGQRVLFMLPESSGKDFTATVSLVGKSIDGNDRTVTVQAIPPDSVRQVLLAGMYIDAAIITDSREAWTLPFDAIITEGNEHFVLKEEPAENGEHVFLKVPVQLGERSGDDMEVIPDEEVTPSTVLLINGVYDARN